MMSIAAYLKRICKRDVAVYWGSPVSDEAGVLRYAAPIEIGCFWKDRMDTIRNKEGREFVSRAEVHVLQDLDESGMLFHGTLSELTNTQEDDPREVTRAYEIERFLKTPSLHLSNTFHRKAIL